MAAGLAQKLRIKPGTKVLLLGAPSGFATQLAPLPPGVALLKRLGVVPDCVIAFVKTRADVPSVAAEVFGLTSGDFLLWFAYPKKSGPLVSDLSRDQGWEPVLERGYDSVAQVSIDDAWTGFRFRPKHLIGKRPK